MALEAGWVAGKSWTVGGWLGGAGQWVGGGHRERRWDGRLDGWAERLGGAGQRVGVEHWERGWPHYHMDYSVCVCVRVCEHRTK